jgi:hypothetical protein
MDFSMPASSAELGDWEIASVQERGDLTFPTSLAQFQRLFPDDAACATYLEKARWEHAFAPDNVVLGRVSPFKPHAGTVGRSISAAGRPLSIRNSFPNLAQTEGRNGPSRSRPDRR